MAKNNKNIIPRPAQKIYIIAALLFFAVLALQPLVYIIDATFRSTPFENIIWLYKSLAFNLFPFGLFGIAYWLTSNIHDRTWRMTIALLCSQLFLGVKEVMNQVVLTLFFTKKLAPAHYDTANLIILGLIVTLLIVTLLIVKRKGRMSEGVRLPLALLIGIYGIYTLIIAYFLTGGKFTLEDIMPYLMTFIQLVLVSCFLVATYLLQPSTRRRPLRLTRTFLYVLIPVLTYFTLNFLLNIVPIIFPRIDFNPLSQFYSALTIILIVITYPGIVLWARHKKTL